MVSDCNGHPLSMAATGWAEIGSLACLRREILSIDGLHSSLVFRRAATEESAALPVSAIKGFQVLFDPAPAGMALLDGDGRVLAGNRAVARLFRSELRCVVGSGLSQVIAPDD